MDPTWKRYLKTGAFYLLVIAIVLYAVVPFVYAISSSLKSGSALFDPSLWPSEITGRNYLSVFEEQPFHKNLLNSIIVAVVVVALSLFLGVTAAYALARVRFRGRTLLLLTILGVSMFPQVAVLSGMFQLLRAFNLYNTLPGLMFSYMIFTLPFTVWVLTTFMRDLPNELEEAAIMDGATPWQTITKVFMPLMWPALVTTGLLAFIAAWNEFLFALTFMLTNDQRTVPVAIALMSGSSKGAGQFEIPWGNIMAASVIVTVPLIILVLIFQRRIVAGLTQGAVKG
ncbi:carbohydrate ABC transporter permease [Haliangium ochraceum]|uniref:Binding-protein-dependent transport systems inner membrane component n=1 Tax=Haliangium ochraceum (strain DSM 14365 / JCM 11303 / SMP-2) TaxID=502025 RepID=D0LSE7_HALO1|nr:carbohydrate ABC transporter permease [Haliangium ochraceum]ACY15646.1 binding-protein-dependent transport systems inner membrane component [Haliangium ochraceum DSM 14365]